MLSRRFFGSFYVAGGLFVLTAQPQVTAWSLVTDAALNARNPEHRKEAVAAIGAIGPAPEPVKFLERVLHNDPEPMVRQAAAASLGEMKAADAVPALRAALEDPNGEVAFSAAKALWDLGDPTGTATFEEILTRERGNSEGFMNGAIHDAKLMVRDPKKLAFMGAKEASGAILGPFSMGFTVAHDALKDSGAAGRALAAEYMTKNCDKRVVQLLKWSLEQDGNWIVKAASARGLGVCGDVDAIPMLEKYLNDSHEPLKYQAAAAIVRLGLKHPAPAAVPAATAATASNAKP